MEKNKRLVLCTLGLAGQLAVLVDIMKEQQVKAAEREEHWRTRKDTGMVYKEIEVSKGVYVQI